MYLFLISQNYIYFALLCFESAKYTDNYDDLTSIGNLFGIITLELVATSIIAGIGLILLSLWRSYRMNGEGMTKNEVNSLSGHLFLMILPFYYFLRIPLIQGIFSNIGAVMDDPS